MYEIRRMFLDVHKKTINIDLWNEVKKTCIEVTLSFRYKTIATIRKCYDYLYGCGAITMNMLSEIYEFYMNQGDE